MVRELKRDDGSVVAAGSELTNYVLSYFQELFTSSAGDHLEELIEKLIPRVSHDMNSNSWRNSLVMRSKLHLIVLAI
jgi:hypothetical protein